MPSKKQAHPRQSSSSAAKPMLRELDIAALDQVSGGASVVPRTPATLAGFDGRQVSGVGLARARLQQVFASHGWAW